MSEPTCCTHHICDCHAARLTAFKRQLDAVEAIARHARQISPSASMTLYVADVERALGMDAPIPHKVGGNDRSTT